MDSILLTGPTHGLLEQRAFEMVDRLADDSLGSILYIARNDGRRDTVTEAWASEYRPMRLRAETLDSVVREWSEKINGPIPRLSGQLNRRLAEYALDEVTKQDGNILSGEPASAGLADTFSSHFALFDEAGVTTADDLKAEFKTSDLDPRIATATVDAYRQYRTLLDRTVDEWFQTRGELFETVSTTKESLSALSPEIDVVILSGYHEFRPIERAIIERLTDEFRMIAILPTHHDGESGVDAVAKEAKATYESLGFEQKRIEPEYGPAAEFAAITNALYRPESHTIETPDTLHWRELPTPEREIRFVARELRTALSNGRDPDDLAVVIPDIEGYGGYVEDTFDTFEIPHVTTAATQLNRTFTGSVVHDLLSLAEQNPHTEDLTSLLANPLVNLVSSDQTAALTAAARRRDTVGLEPLLKTVDIETRTQIQELLSTLDVLRSGDLDEATNSLRRLLDEELGLPTAIEDYASETERAVEKQAYDLVVEVLDSFGPLYNISSELSPLAVFSRGFDGIPIRIPQSTASGAVEVMGMLDARMRSFEKVFIVGLTSEQFPVSPERPAFFEEMTDATPRFERPDERLRGRYLFATLLANCDDVILTTPETGDEDSAVVRSPVLDELQRVTDIEPTEGVDDRVGSREDLQRHIADCTDRRAAVDQAGTHGDLSARQTKRTDRGLLCADNRRTASLSQHDGILRPETVDEVYPATKREPYSASRIERYVECGFKFYAEKVLGIEDADPVEVTPTPLETGSYVHDVLESFYAGIQAETNDRDSESVDIAAYERRELEQRLLEVALDELSGTDFEYEGVFYTHWLTELFAGLGDEEANPYAKSTRPYETPERGLFAAFLDEEISQNTDSQPRWFETPFGEGLPDSEAGPCEVERPDGSTVSIRGYIDRVDVTGNDESPRLNLYDYKTGRAPYMTRTTGGTKFQLPIYLLAADKTVSQELLAEATLSATYYQVRPPNDIKVPRGIESKFDSQAELRQFLAEIVPEWLGAVDDAISKGRFHTTLLSSREAHCQYCDYRRACDVRHHRKREHRTEAQSDESAYVPLRAQDDANLREVMSDD